MKKYSCYLYSLIFILLIQYSCKNSTDDIDVANNLISTNGKMALIDTFTIRTSTIKMDSIATSGYSKAYSGTYSDGNFGKITSKSFFRLQMPSPNNIQRLIGEPYYDSLVLLTHINYFYGDTLTPYTLEVHKLQSRLDNYNIAKSPYLYNLTTTPLYDTKSILGSASTYVKPKSIDSLYVKLDSIFGKQIMYKLVNDNYDFLNQEDFLKYFEGLAIVPGGSSNNLILGFNANIGDKNGKNLKVRLYYHYLDGLNQIYQRTVDFNLINPELQYNSITVDPKSTPLSKLTKTTKYPSELTDGETYIQAGTGLRMKLELPYLFNLCNSPFNYRILSANLYLTPKNNTNLLIPWPTLLQLYATSEDNADFTPITVGNLVDQSATNLLYPAYYNFDITTYVKFILLNPNLPIPQLVATTLLDGYPNTILNSGLSDQSKSNLDRLIIKNGFLRENSTRLQIMYYRY